MWPDEVRPWHGAYVKAQADSLTAVGIDLELVTMPGYASRSHYLCAAAKARALNQVIPNGVDMERFRPIPRDEARARLGWSTSDRIVLFVGNPELTVKNFALAEEVHRLVAGRSGPVELKVGSSVEPAEMPLWMSAADALLLTSRSEGSPNVIKEAMAMELP